MPKTPRKTFSLLILLIFFFGFNQRAGAFENIVQLCLQYKPFTIDISSLMDFYGTLKLDEKEEQLRDWGFYGLFSSLGLKQNEINSVTGEEMPMRYPSLGKNRDFTVLPGRIACLDKKNCIMLVRQNDINDPLILARIFDTGRISFETIPENVLIFSYSADTEKGEISTSYVRTVKGSDLLGPDYGYMKTSIPDAAALAKFLNDANCLTSLEFKDNAVVVAGRKNRFGKTASLSIEDIASLYQAYIKYFPKEAETERRKSYDAFIAQKYSELTKNDKKLRKDIKDGKVRYAYIIAQIKKHYPYTSLEDEDSNVGFSLDPLFDYDGFSKDLKALASGSGRYADLNQDKELAALVARFHDGLLSSSQKLGLKHDIIPFLKLRRMLSAPKTNAEKYLDTLLYDIELDNTYQTARYDGRLKGTSPAMILFYTDLTAKLWALDYNKLSPKNAITGFQTLAEIKVPKLYWNDFIKLSKTRLWFGLRQESFDINPDSINFEPVATRVYAASSDPLYPGKETKPNFQSGKFLGWWDSHYAAVADYEPYYYKLNELLKWSAIFMVVKEKHSHTFDFLKDVGINRNLDFESWYKNENTIKNKAALPFVDRKRFNRNTECFKILSSKSYLIMGQNFFVSGGVSLASKKDIQRKLFKQRGNRREEISQAHVNKVRFPKTYAKNTGRKNENPASKENHEQAVKKTGYQERAKNNFGDFSAKVEKQSVKLEWNKKEGAVLDECVNSLAKLQETDSRVRKSENIFTKLKDIEKVVRIETGKAYILKTKALKDRWIYVSVNPKGKPSGFEAEAAGTEPDSDIFYAKVIDPATAESLSANKIVLPITP